jgi:outer membrane biosynthesis protein TonB
MMLKSILLAGAVMISAPVLAQEAPAQETTPPAQEQATPPAAEQPAAPAETPAPAEQPAETAQQPQEATPAEQPAQTAEQPAATTEQPAQTAQSTPSSGQQPANATQIAQVVDQGFPTYDKDADGSLKAEEFNSWMVALRSASEPAFQGQSAADKEWLTRALAAADADKSGGVNKEELKSFLAPAAAS